MTQPYRQQLLAALARGTAAARALVVGTVLAMSLLASLWQVGQSIPRLAATASSSSVAGEERGETQAEEESPAKLRRATTRPCAARAAQPFPALQRQAATVATVAHDARPSHGWQQPPPALTRLRQQRGQAPPQG